MKSFTSIPLFLAFLILKAHQITADGCKRIPIPFADDRYLCGEVHNNSPYTMRYTVYENEDNWTKDTPNLCAFWNWSAGITQPDHAQTVWCKQEPLSPGGNYGGGKYHHDADGFTFADRNYLWGKRYDVITKGVWTKVHDGSSVTCTGGGGPKGDMPVCKLD
jgi:hypothetical protein